MSAALTKDEAKHIQSTNLTSCVWQYLYSYRELKKAMAGQKEIDPRQGQGRDFISWAPRPDCLWGTFSLPYKEYRGLPPGLERKGLENDTTPPPSTKLKNAWSYISTPPYVFMAW
jgi:hypothetical protein